MSLERPPHQIFYIGKKPVKHDTVAGTGLIWSGYGDSHMVPHSSAILLLQHTEVWCGKEKFALLNPETGEQEQDTDGDIDESTGDTGAGLSGVVTGFGKEIAGGAQGAQGVRGVQAPEAPTVPQVPETPPQVPEAPTVPQAPETNGDDARISVIINAILSLSRDNPEHFSVQTGNPIVGAVRDAANDQEISVKDVNAAWKKLNQPKAE